MNRLWTGVATVLLLLLAMSGCGQSQSGAIDSMASDLSSLNDLLDGVRSRQDGEKAANKATIIAKRMERRAQNMGGLKAPSPAAYAEFQRTTLPRYQRQVARFEANWNRLSSTDWAGQMTYIAGACHTAKDAIRRVSMPRDPGPVATPTPAAPPPPAAAAPDPTITASGTPAPAAPAIRPEDAWKTAPIVEKNEKVEVFWQGLWWSGTVVASRGDHVQVQYTAGDAARTDWLPLSQVRPALPEPTAPPAPAPPPPPPVVETPAPPPAAPPPPAPIAEPAPAPPAMTKAETVKEEPKSPPPARPSVPASSLRPGTKVEVQSGTKWKPAIIMKSQGDKVLVHYSGMESRYDEWVNEARVREPAPK